MTFYIPEFACGVLLTLAAEFIILIVFAVYSASKDKKGDGSNAEESNPIPSSTYNRDGTQNDSTGKNH